MAEKIILETLEKLNKKYPKYLEFNKIPQEHRTLLHSGNMIDYTDNHKSIRLNAEGLKLYTQLKLSKNLEEQKEIINKLNETIGKHNQYIKKFNKSTEKYNGTILILTAIVGVFALLQLLDIKLNPFYMISRLILAAFLVCFILLKVFEKQGNIQLQEAMASLLTPLFLLLFVMLVAWLLSSVNLLGKNISLTEEQITENTSNFKNESTALIKGDQLYGVLLPSFWIVNFFKAQQHPNSTPKTSRNQ